MYICLNYAVCYRTLVVVISNFSCVKGDALIIINICMNFRAKSIGIFLTLSNIMLPIYSGGIKFICITFTRISLLHSI